MLDVMTGIYSLVAFHRDAIISLLRDIVAIPSFDSNIRDVVRGRTTWSRFQQDWNSGKMALRLTLIQLQESYE